MLSTSFHHLYAVWYRITNWRSQKLLLPVKNVWGVPIPVPYYESNFKVQVCVFVVLNNGIQAHKSSLIDMLKRVWNLLADMKWSCTIVLRLPDAKLVTYCTNYRVCGTMGLFKQSL